MTGISTIHFALRLTLAILMGTAIDLESSGGSVSRERGRLLWVRLVCKRSATAHIHSLLLPTIGKLPLTLQSIHSHQDDDGVETEIRAEAITAGRNKRSDAFLG